MSIKVKKITSSYILTLSLKTTISDTIALNKYFELSRRLYNAILDETLKRLKLMRESKLYNKARKKIDKKTKKELFKQAEIKYGFREYDISKFATTLMVNEYKTLGSHIKSKLVKRAFNAVNKLRFGNAKRVNFIRKDEMYSIEGADNKQAIKYRDGIIIFNKLKMPIIVKNNDKYAQKALQDRVKYCRFVKKIINGKTKYYVQLVLEGIPPQKINQETGEIKVSLGEGRVGIDNGTQTSAVCSKYQVSLVELAPEINDIHNEITKIQRKLDRSRRKTNLNKFNEDGTINIYNKDKWVKSNKYIKLQNQLKELNRLQVEIRKISHNKLANEWLKLGDEFYVETMNYSGLQRRRKETTKNKNGKFNKKKRFGKSLANKAPSKFLEILNRKLKYFGKELHKINTYTVKASQYNHFNNEYNKKQLKDRWNYFNINNKEIKIQRDLYSAFLIMNVNDKMDKVDRIKCFETFDNFKILHDKEIERIMSSNNKKISSMGI